MQETTAVSQSSTESEIISLDTGLRLDGLPPLELWDLIVSVPGNVSRVSDGTEQPHSDDLLGKSLFYCVHVKTRCAFLGTLEPTRMCWETCQVHTTALRRKTNCDKGNELCMIVTVLLG